MVPTSMVQYVQTFVLFSHSVTNWWTERQTTASCQQIITQLCMHTHSGSVFVSKNLFLLLF